MIKLINVFAQTRKGISIIYTKIGNWKIWKWIEAHHNTINLILTAIAILVAYSLLRQTQRQVEEAKRINDSTIVNMGRTLKLTKEIAAQNDSTTRAVLDSTLQRTDSSLALTNRNLEMAQNNFEIQTRANISIVHILPANLEIGQPIKITARFTNEGYTPAYNALIDARLGIYTEKIMFAIMDSTMMQNPFPEKWNGSTWDIREERTSEPESEWIHNAEADSLIKNYHKTLYYWTVIIYQDAFKHKRFKYLCAEYNVFLKKFFIVDKYTKAN